MSRRRMIAALARAGGVGVETVRYYQRLGLVDEPPRPPRGVRRYGDDAVERLRFIRAAKATGFTLVEIAELIRIGRRPSCRAGRDLAAERLGAVEGRMAELAVLRDTLRLWVAQCDANDDDSACPPLAALAPVDAA
ncbi:MAG: MerR family DNA-binding protein [Caulobacteraceae bacterium]